MLTQERMAEISQLVDVWEHDQRIQEEYPSDYDLRNCVESIMDDDPARFLEVADELGLDPEELRQWVNQIRKETADEYGL